MRIIEILLHTIVVNHNLKGRFAGSWISGLLLVLKSNVRNVKPEYRC